MKHPHEILGVDRDADLEAIKRAYLKLAQTAHPDVGGSKKDFIRLRAAYETMLNGCPAPSVEPVRTEWRDEPEPYSAAEKESYEEIIKAFRERLDRDVWRHATKDSWQPKPANDVCWAITLTAISAGAIGTWLSYDGQSFDPSLWSFSCAATMAVLVCFCGLASLVGATPLLSGWTVYRRLMMFFAILSVLLLVPHMGGTPPARREPRLSRESVPDWWPVSRRRVLRNDWARTDPSHGFHPQGPGRLVSQPFFQRMLQPFTRVPKVPRPSPGP